MNVATHAAIMFTLTLTITFAGSYLGTRSGIRLAHLHEHPHDTRIRIRSRRKLRALADAIVRLREAGVARATQAIREADDELASDAGDRARADIEAIVGKRRVKAVFDRYVFPQAERLLTRNRNAHDAVHHRLLTMLLRQMPSEILERITEGTGPLMGMSCGAEEFELDPQVAAAEARRVLEARKAAE